MKLAPKTIVWLAILLAAAGSYAAYRSFGASRGPALKTVEVRRGNIVEIVSETGQVVAIDDLRLFFERAGRVEEVLVKEGDVVKEGQPLMRLRAADLAIRRQDALAAVRSAEARYAQALAGPTDEQVRLAETAVRNAELALAARERALEDLRVSNDAALERSASDLVAALESLSLRSATAMQVLRNDAYDGTRNFRPDFTVVDSIAGTAARNAYEAAAAALPGMERDAASLRGATRADVDRLAPGILAAGRTIRDAVSAANLVLQTALPHSISQGELDARKTRLQSSWADASAAVNAAEAARLAVVSVSAENVRAENAAKKERDAASLALLAAEQELARVKAPLRDVDRAIHLAAIASARAALALVEQEIADSTLRAPLDGVIGSVDIKAGELAAPSVPVATLVSSVHEIEAEVSELDIAKVRPGQAVRIAFDALEGRTFSGRIGRIASRETLSDGDVFYRVRVSIEDEDVPARIGMTADLGIVVGERTDVLLVPRRQVLRRGGVDRVKLVRNGEVEEVEATVGLRGRDDYEIVSGVREGDRVLVE